MLDAEKLIAAKARNILRHYAGAALPGGFKAQLVAHNRRTTLRYRDALLKTRDELAAQIEMLSRSTRSADPEDLRPRTALLVRAARHLDLLKAMDFVPVISVGTANDEERYSIEGLAGALMAGLAVREGVTLAGRAERARFAVAFAGASPGPRSPVPGYGRWDSDLVRAAARLTRDAAGMCAWRVPAVDRAVSVDLRYTCHVLPVGLPTGVGRGLWCRRREAAR